MFNESCSLYRRAPGTPSKAAKSCYYYVQWAGHFICNPDFHVDRTNMKSILILYTKSGSGKLEYRNTTYELKPKSAAVINCIEDHTYYPIDNWDFCYIHFYGSSSINMAENIFATADGAVIDGVSRIMPMIFDILKRTEDGGPVNEIVTSKIINDILTELLLTVSFHENDRIGQICDYISKNFDKPLSVEVLAQMSYFSRSYLSVIFKRTTGSTLHDYILNCRINQAKKMLADSEMSVAEIAENVGISDSSSFIRMFKKHEGISPLQYRKAERI